MGSDWNTLDQIISKKIQGYRTRQKKKIRKIKERRKKETQGRGNTFQMQMLWRKGKKTEARFQKYVPKPKQAQKPIKKQK